MRLPLLGLAVVCLLSCERAPDSELPTAASPAPAPAPAPRPATLLGKVCFQGKPPPPAAHEVPVEMEKMKWVPQRRMEVQTVTVNGNGTLKDVFVFIGKGLEGMEFPVSEDPVLLGFESCQFIPRTFGILVHQELLVKDRDRAGEYPHSISRPRKSGYTNFRNQPPSRPFKTTFTIPGMGGKLRCEIHPWEAAYAHVMAHPFFAVTGGDGEFRIEGIPPGRYTLSAWHDVLGTREVEVQLHPAETWVVDFDYEGS